MRVAVGAVVGTVGGPAVYARQLVAAMAATAGGPELIVLSDKPQEFEGLCRTVFLPLASAWEQPVWDHYKVPAALRGLGVDLYHGTKGVLPFFGSTPAVVTVHDLAVYTFSQTFSFAQRLHQRVETPHTLKTARRVITVSSASAKDIGSIFPSAGERTVIIPNGVCERSGPPNEQLVDRWRKAQQPPLGRGPTVGYLGTVQPRKNVDLLVQAFQDVASSDWNLLIAGRIRPGYHPRFLSSKDPRIRYLGVLEDDDVPVFLGSLDVMASPSLCEGFGLTLVEAMAVGTPVVAFNVSAVPEVVADAGLLVEPDAEALGVAIKRVVGDRALAARLASRGRERAAGFTWQEAARRTIEVYQQAVAERQR